MKNFGSLLLAAITGSAITFFGTTWFFPNNHNSKIEHALKLPSSKVGFQVNENNQVITLDFVSTAEKVTPAVVHIRAATDDQSRLSYNNDPFQFFFGPKTPSSPQAPSISSGSGVIINADGYIVTNNHVIHDADMLEVTLFDNRTYKAKIIGTDVDTDLAVIKIDEKSLPYLSFFNSDLSRVGEWVLAVGNPFNLTSTVTAGIISAKSRNIGIIRNENDPTSPGRTAIESFIQTDAAINPGNSGGALVNLKGELLGINTAIASSTGSYTGYGFAIPSNLVSKVVEDLLTYGTVQRGWLGIQVQSIDDNLRKEKSLAVKEGAFVADFPEKSAAKEAGLKIGDVIVKLDSSVILSSTALIEYIGQKRPGDKIHVAVNRFGKEFTFIVILKNKEGKIGMVKHDEKDSTLSLGLEVEDIDLSILKALDLDHGVRVKNLLQGKISRYTDMRSGFIITRIDDKAVKSAKEVEKLLSEKKPGDLITLSGIYKEKHREYIYAIRK